MKRGVVLGGVLVAMACALVMVGCEPTDTGFPAALGTKGPEGAGFLWKPISHNDGKLVVLIPVQYRGKVGSCVVANPDGETIEKGRFAGDIHNGGRSHFRFEKSGAEFGENIYVVADVGELLHWHIPNGAARTEL